MTSKFSSPETQPASSVLRTAGKANRTVSSEIYMGDVLFLLRVLNRSPEAKRGVRMATSRCGLSFGDARNALK